MLHVEKNGTTMARETRVALPPEIVAMQRQRRQRTLRLYGIAVGVIALLSLGLLFGYGSLFNAGITTDLRFSNAFSAASAALSKGEVRVADQQMRAAVAIRDNYSVRYDLGIILLKEGQYAASLTQWRKAATFKRSPDVYWYASIADLAMHRPDLALIQARQAVRLDPIEGYYHAALAMAQRALGHTALAAREFATARSYDYTGQTLQDWIAQARFVDTTPKGGGNS